RYALTTLLSDRYPDRRAPHSFPTRRSSDLVPGRTNDMTSRMAGRILVTAWLISPLAARAQSDDFPFLEATVAQLQARMASGALTSVRLTRAYIERIHALDSSANGVNTIIELKPDALTIAQHMDNMRRAGHVLGPRSEERRVGEGCGG